ncbi:ATP-binding protein [Crateriforma conspicua]|uniref:Chromosome partition protein Smc n=1 Tax=Crateriforma conspicua TaxID=2527996 RepID=A0A5C6FQJ8_9PLAN|nr:ATP-binding protein [Crateriforma conspicua]TWU64544.1 Chromosome partition protein Smc [Crateriforma conspicua]
MSDDVSSRQPHSSENGVAHQATLFEGDPEPTQPETSYRLTHLEVFNWGPFSKLHRAEFDLAGTAIIGPTGSGKTTLIDALMTLLVAAPRYNLASTGGVESDRSLISYVRGLMGGDGGGGGDSVSRPGKTITGICACYRESSVVDEATSPTETDSSPRPLPTSSEAETIRLGGLLWTDGPSDSLSDLKRRWIFSLAEDQTLENWLRVLHDEGARGITKLERETSRLQTFNSKKAYLARIQKFFDVGENAFTLLNRAAGLKQLNSIDEIFRDLVLDDRTMFDRAIEVAGEFDNLAEIHTELEIAKMQYESLLPIKRDHDELKKLNQKTDTLRNLKRIMPTYFAIRSEAAWRAELVRINDRRDDVASQIKTQQHELDLQQTKTDTLKEAYLQLGGNVIGELEKTIEVLRREVAARKKYAEDYLQLLRPFQLDEQLTETALRQNQQVLGSRREETQSARDAQHGRTLSVMASQQRIGEEAAEVAESLRKVKARPASNIPPRFGDFRGELAARLQLGEDDLPFLAELVEVKSDQSSWRGAIERALGSERLRILVPEDHIDEALRWINSRNNRLHVRLQRARTDDDQARFFDDGYARKLNYKSHPLIATAKRMIAGRDMHCVSSTKELRYTEHALTMEGTMSGRGGRFEKQDRRRLDDDWMTGFDNQAQLRNLLDRLSELEAKNRDSEIEAKAEQRKLAEIDGKLLAIDQLLKLDFATIDLPSAQAELKSSEARLQRLLDPNSDASQAKIHYEAERRKQDSLAGEISALQTKVAVLTRDAQQAEKERASAEARIAEGLSPDETAIAEKRIGIPDDTAAEDLDNVERHYLKQIDEKLHRSLEKVQNQEKRLIALMGSAQQADTGAMSDTGTDIADIPDYLDRLRVLTEEALPEKQRRFREYLTQSSDQGVTQMLAGIEEEVDAIEQRIAELNHTLAEVDFRDNRYLQLLPRRISHERLRALNTALQRVRSSALKDDEGQSHYKSLRELVEILRAAADNRRQLGSRALLDPRYRLEFFVVEVDRKSGHRGQPRSGSQSGSGGEKELMASHILTASLSYALCPAEASRPLYATVVLDEAFSKSSPSAANRIIDALCIFHLHPIFVTPNKEIGLLKKHTRRVICVQRQGRTSTLASISWEILEELSKRP